MLLLDILPAHSKPVHGRVVPRGVIPRSDDIFRQHAAERIEQSDFLDRKRLSRCQDYLLSLMKRRKSLHDDSHIRQWAIG